MLLAIQPQKAVINDINAELMTTYQVIRESTTDLVKSLKRLVAEHNHAYDSGGESATEAFYKSVRSQQIEDLSDIAIATRFIYLNKTGFNGMYRVNSDGKFNVPFGKKYHLDNKTVFSEANLKRLASYMQKSMMQCLSGDFLATTREAQAGDFVFFDSPYDESWVGYAKGGFGESDHRRLAQEFWRLTELGVKVILTNHNTGLMQELYGNATHYLTIPVNRMISSNADTRMNAAEEIIVTNYPLTHRQLEKFRVAKWWKQLKPTSFVLKDYVNWAKISEYFSQYTLEMNDLNILFSKSVEEFENKARQLYSKRPESFEILPMLLSVSYASDKPFTYLLGNEIKTFKVILDQETGKGTNFEEVLSFLSVSGLRDQLFMDSRFKSVNEYVFGVKVGLSSADKKNKSGQWMSYQIQKLLTEHVIKYEKEVSYNSILGQVVVQRSDKRFDFVFEKEGIKYLLETNFFNKSGSKINSEADRFMALNHKIQEYDGLKFIWVTDGVGLRSAKDKINKALDQMTDNLFNLDTFEDWLKN